MPEQQVISPVYSKPSRWRMVREDPAMNADLNQRSFVTGLGAALGMAAQQAIQGPRDPRPINPMWSDSVRPQNIAGMQVQTAPVRSRKRYSSGLLAKDMDQLISQDPLSATAFDNFYLKNVFNVEGKESNELRRVVEQIPATAPIELDSSSPYAYAWHDPSLDRIFYGKTAVDYSDYYRRKNSDFPLATLIHESTHANTDTRNGFGIPVNDAYPGLEIPAMVEQYAGSAIGNPDKKAQYFGIHDAGWVAQQARRHGLVPGSANFYDLYNRDPSTRQWTRQLIERAKRELGYRGQ